MNPVSVDKPRMLVLLWHSPQQQITAGGFKRALEILKRAPGEWDILVLDDEPSFLKGLEAEGFRIIEYRIPRVLRRMANRFFTLGRLLEWVWAFLLMTAACLRLRFLGESFDIVYVPSAEQVPALASAVIARHLFHSRLVACNMNIEIFPKPLRAPFARLHNSADSVITLSRDLAKNLRTYGVKAPIKVNGVGLDYEFIRASVAELPPAKSFDAVYVGRHDREKGIFDLIECWELVVDRLPNARLITVGYCNPVNLSKLKSAIREKGIGRNVVLAGVVDEMEKLSIIHASRICLFPSYVEGWAIAPQECLACGLPVITYDLPVYAENIKPCEAVITVPVGDRSRMAAETCGLLTSEAWSRYADIGPRFVRQFEWESVARKEFEILRGDA